jgi:hypothetical protein
MKLLLFTISVLFLSTATAKYRKNVHQQLKTAKFKTLDDKSGQLFSCMTNPATTSVHARVVGDKIQLNIFHYHGVRWSPIHTGTITAEDFPYLRKKGEDIHAMGEYVEVDFPKEECRQGSHPWEFTCHSNSPRTIGGIEVKSYGFMTYRRTSELYNMTFHELQFDFYFRPKSLTRSMLIPYDWSFCEF